ncbi:alpha/beta-hydrolase [Hyaloscypha hepaticicola]|uniref:Carboxylic ester hydrolase n=1 Tax=Hyaloscypha hepaticicola TaxID=2082293 RepID=A0A2J6QID7_9HELO|nr:alpha/beta-hydrolase [Hyaloscypha hepaticicola]
MFLLIPNEVISLAVPASQKWKTIEQDVGSFRDIAFSLCALPSRDNVWKALLVGFLFSYHLRIRAAMSFPFIVIFFLVTHLVRCTSTNDPDSTLSIIINNDLLGSESPSADSDVILLSPRSRIYAASACAALGEQLWSPELKTSSIQPNLDYLTSGGQFSADQQYWIASTRNTSRAIDGHGNIANTSTTLSAYLQLPILCTQSAPFSNSTYQNTSSQWQVTVYSNNEYITGRSICSPADEITYSTPYKGTASSDATTYGSQCVQSGGGSEDCLFLNIWTTHFPAHSGSKQLKPVMFWIHAGAFISSTANDPIFDGGNIASRGDVVMVAINYRLSTLGFLALDDGVTTGNYGFTDQINALDWVWNNIEDFGGDPDRITIFGQSAGAASVRAMLASPKSIGKFTGAIPQSNLGGGGYGTTYSLWLSTADVMKIAVNSILNTTNCSTAVSQLDCLHHVSAASLVTGIVARYLVVDGTYLTSSSLILNGTGANLSNIHLMQGLISR